MKPKLILASASIGRKSLLEKLGVPFDIHISDIDEDAITDPDPYVMIQKRSEAKAQNVAGFWSRRKTPPQNDILIIAADSAAIYKNHVYGKPQDRKHAFTIIKELQGNTHALATGMTVIKYNGYNNYKSYKSTLTKTHVTIRPMTDSAIRKYVHHYDLRRFAAGYALNMTPWDMITKIDGSMTNVIGLPLEELLPILQDHKLL